ncbi:MULTISPECIES: Panacea domain-containing protein [Sphingomonas]|uniref:Panacea domain-containing protein n=1 Tax=Sphingomonas TaxID=13687 RepID=UPI000DEF9C38|nr:MULTISPECIES: type II toxin-antitoxin system antitoxin SocA domain-containing protein [Sphingomonas]
MEQPVSTPEAIANYLLRESRDCGELLTNLKLQKLLYYADAWFMVFKDRPLFRERFQAWVHGPVLVSQYHRFKEHQWRPITSDVPEVELSADIAEHCSEILEIFGTESAVALELMTHREQPWIEARGGLPDSDPCSTYISADTTQSFYRSL